MIDHTTEGHEGSRLSELVRRQAGLRGRRTERAAVAAFLVTARRGPASLTFAGEHGMGKTTLWSHAVAAAEEAGLRVLTARATEPESDLRFTVLTDLLEPVIDPVLPALLEPQRAALEHALLRRGEPDGRQAVRVVAQATLATLRLLSVTSGILVALDNLHWADAPSRAVLTFAQRRLHRERVGLLVTSEAPAASEYMEISAGADTHMLGALEEDAFTAVVQSEAPFLSPLAVGRLYESTGGNPGAALAIVQEIRRHGGPHLRLDRFPVPDRFAAPFTTALAGLPPTTEHLLLAAAVMSRPTVQEIGAATGHAVTGRGGLDPAIDGGLLRVDGDHVRFVHPLLPSIVCNRASVADRRAMHAKLATAANNSDERTRHQAFATVGTDEIIASRLERGARAAVARGAFAQAAELAVEAVRCTAAEAQGDASRRRTLAADALVTAGNPTAAQQLLERVAADADQRGARGQALLKLAVLRRGSGDVGASCALLALAADLVSGDVEVRAVIEREAAWTALIAGDVHGARGHASRAVTLARTIGKGGELAGALAVHAAVASAAGEPDDRPALVEATSMPGAGALPLHADPRLTLALLDLGSGSLHGARSALEQLHRSLLLHGRDADVPLLLGHLASVECRAARWRRALGYVADGQASAAATGQHLALPLLHQAAAIAHAAQGDLGAAREAAMTGAAIAEQQGAVLWGWHNSWALGVIALSDGELEAALRHLLATVTASHTAGLVGAAEAPWVPDAVETLIGLGNLDHAEELLVRYEEALTRSDRPVAVAMADRCRGLLAAATGDRAEALACLERSVKQLGVLDQPFELARGHLALGITQRRERKATAAARSFQTAVTLFEDVGARQWAQRILRELPAGREDRGAGGLTAVEGRVARLASEGNTNREIAARLYMSPRTVESHLTGIYRKLDIRSRVELGRLLAAPRDAVQPPLANPH